MRGLEDVLYSGNGVMSLLVHGSGVDDNSLSFVLWLYAPFVYRGFAPTTSAVSESVEETVRLALVNIRDTSNSEDVHTSTTIITNLDSDEAEYVLTFLLSAMVLHNIMMSKMKCRVRVTCVSR